MKDIIKVIINKAIEGNLSFKELMDLWPEELEDDVYFNEVYENIESSIEHYTGFLFSRKPNYDAWFGMEEYYLLKVDMSLISLNIDSEKILRVRNELIKTHPDINCLDKKVNEIINYQNV